MNIEHDNVINDVAKEFCRYESIERAALFGSRARGDFGERSDYDIAVYGNLSAKEKIALRYFCDEELRTLHKIDLIFMNEPHDEKFEHNIRTEGITFYEKTGKQIR